MKIVLILMAFVMSTPGHSKDILSVYHSALKIDPQYRAAIASYDAGIEKESQARAGLLPTVALTGNAAKNQQNSVMRFDGAEPIDANFKTSGWTLQITQPLFRWKNWISLSQGELSKTAAELQLRDASQDLILRVAKTYFDLYLANENLKSLEIQKAAAQEQLSLAKRSHESGMAPSIDIDEARSRLDLLAVQILSGTKDVFAKRKALSLLSGNVVIATKKLREEFPLRAASLSDRDAYVAIAEESNLNVKLAEISLAIAGHERDKQRAEHLPTIDLVVSKGRALTGNNIAYGFERPGTDVDTTTLGIQATFPIFSGGLIHSKEREAIALREKALFDVQRSKQDAALGADQAFLDITMGMSQIKAFESAIQSSRAMLSATKIGYEIGSRINLDVLNSQRQFSDTLQRLAKVKLDTLLAGLRLKAIVGDLVEKDLMEVATFFE